MKKKQTARKRNQKSRGTRPGNRPKNRPRNNVLKNGPESADRPAVSRTYKARLFEMIFSQKKELLELYNAMNGTDYRDPELLQINTLENAIYMSMHNDLSFIIDSRLTLYEHQSTYSPNLPLRCLMYVSDLYSDITKDENLYGKKAVSIPTPRFVIFYNGIEDRPDMEILKLSDLYSVPDDDIALELKALILNINPGHNTKLLETCKTLRDYSEYTHRVRTYANTMPLEDAVERAITECIRDDILADFLRKYRAEAKSVSIYEYDEEKHMRCVREEGREEGMKEGIKEGIKRGIQEGEKRFASLTQILVDTGKTKELLRATTDKEYRDKLYLEYKL